MNNLINTFFSIYTTIKFHDVKTFFFIIVQHTCFCIYQTLKNIFFFLTWHCLFAASVLIGMYNTKMTVDTCRNSVDISQWLTRTSFVHAEENLKKKGKRLILLHVLFPSENKYSNKYFKELPVKSVHVRTYHQDAWYRQKINPWTNQCVTIF